MSDEENIIWTKIGRLLAKVYIKIKNSFSWIGYILKKQKFRLLALLLFAIIYNFCFRYSYSISNMEGNQTVFIQWKFDSLTDNVYFRVFTFGHFTDWQNAKSATIKPKSSQRQ